MPRVNLDNEKSVYQWGAFRWRFANQNWRSHNSQSEECKITQEAGENAEEKQGKCLKRGRTQVSKSQSVSALDLIDRNILDT